MRTAKKIIGAIYRELKDTFFWMKVPNNSFKETGVFFHNNFLDGDTCDELKDLAENIFLDKQELNKDSWINIRERETKGKVDTKVKAIFSFNENSKKLDEFIESRKLQNLFEKVLGHELILRNCCLQYDEPDTETKRSFHTDNNPPPSFKAFIYLTDVDETKNGPFSVIEGTHRKARYLRLKNINYNLKNNLPTSNMDKYIPSKPETPFCGKKGDLILSTQTLFHRGNPDHSERTRYVLIFYFSLKKYGPYPEFKLGKAS